MTNVLSQHDALIAIHKLIVYAKSKACEEGAEELAALLNDIELLPTLLADQQCRSEEFLEMVAGIVDTHPRCQFILNSLEICKYDEVREGVGA